MMASVVEPPSSSEGSIVRKKEKGKKEAGKGDGMNDMGGRLFEEEGAGWKGSRRPPIPSPYSPSPFVGLLTKEEVQKPKKKRSKRKKKNLKEQQQQQLLLKNNEHAAEEEGVTDGYVFPYTVYIFTEAFKKEELMLNVYALNSSSISIFAVTKYPLCHWHSMGYTAHGSKLYATGGANVNSACGYSTEVFICDLSKEKGVGGEHEWKKGPALTAIKPSPMVVAVEGRIYALAGHAKYYRFGVPPEKVDPVFEVLEPEEKVWHPLPNPPFMSFYGKSCGPILISHTVIGKIIYVRVRNPDNEGGVHVLYSYDVAGGQWNEHTPGGGAVYGDPKLDNLKDHFWFDRADVVDGKLYSSYVTSGGYLEVFAHDLTAQKDEVVKRKKEKTNGAASSTSTNEVHDGDSICWDVVSDPKHSDYGVPFIKLPVKSLRYIGSSSFVAHLGSQMLLVVCAYNPPPKCPYHGRIVYTCLLKLVMEEGISRTRGSQNLRDCAVIVKQEYFNIGCNYLSFKPHAWSTM